MYAVSRSVVLREAGVDTPDFFQYILELANGATAIVENCWIVNESSPSVFDFQCEFIASKGSAYVNASHNRTVEIYTDRGVQLPGRGGRAGPLRESRSASASRRSSISLNAWSTAKQPIVTGEDGLRATLVVAAIEESARTRQPVDLQ